MYQYGNGQINCGLFVQCNSINYENEGTRAICNNWTIFKNIFFEQKQDTEGCINAETIFMLYKNINVEFIF